MLEIVLLYDECAWLLILIVCADCSQCLINLSLYCHNYKSYVENKKIYLYTVPLLVWRDQSHVLKAA